MRKFWGNFFRYIKTNKRNSLFILTTAIVVIFIVARDTNFNLNPLSQVKGTNLESDTKLQKLIKENIEKYQPKRSWLDSNPQSLPISAKSAVILDYNSNELLFAENENAQLPPASITKVLTAAVVLENVKTDQLCTISEKVAATEPNRITMKAGEQMKIEDLLYGLMMISANDAAEALAECYPGGREAFMDKMNEKVRELGLKNTHFVNPNGLHDDNHFSSAFDMATVTNYALKSNPDFIKYFGRKGDYSVYPSEHNESHWWSQISNLLQTYPGMDGAKTGFTYEAGNTYIGTAKRNGKRIIIVYFNANSTTYDAKLLLDQGFYLSNLLK